MGTTENAVEPTAMMNATPEPQHRWLQRLVGEWTMEAEARDLSKPGSPPETSTGTERVRALGELWIIAEAEGQMPDRSPARNIMTLGYDPQRQRFVGTWVGSMMTHLWVYVAALDGSENVLTLDTEGPSMKGEGTMAKYQETLECPPGVHLPRARRRRPVARFHDRALPPEELAHTNGHGLRSAAAA